MLFEYIYNDSSFIWRKLTKTGETGELRILSAKINNSPAKRHDFWFAKKKFPPPENFSDVKGC